MAAAMSLLTPRIAVRTRSSKSTRDYSFCTLAAQTPANITKLGRKWGCGGSGTSANGTFLTNVGTFQVQGNQFVAGVDAVQLRAVQLLPAS